MTLLRLLPLLPAGALCAAPEIRWLPDHSAVEVTDFPPGAATDDRIQKMLTVRVADADAGLPALLGRCSWTGNALRFTPRFPFVPGTRYEAVFRPPQGKALTAKHTIPEPGAAGTAVAHIYPDSEAVPENLLKFYLHFSAPMSRGDVYRHIHLRDAQGKAVELPFLELAEELWNPEMTRLTLFIDPGRVKREVKPLEDIGPALVAGQTFTLSIDAAWPDAAGRPLQQGAEKKFLVTVPDRTPPDAKTWRAAPPAAGGREPLRLTFPEPLDQALALRLITVAGVSGKPALRAGGTQWSFVPDTSWRAGAHTIVVQPELEDLAGNSIGKPFEVDIAGTEKERPAVQAVELPFTVK